MLSSDEDSTLMEETQLPGSPTRSPTPHTSDGFVNSPRPVTPPDLQERGSGGEAAFGSSGAALRHSATHTTAQSGVGEPRLLDTGDGGSVRSSIEEGYTFPTLQDEPEVAQVHDAEREGDATTEGRDARGVPFAPSPPTWAGAGRREAAAEAAPAPAPAPPSGGNSAEETDAKMAQLLEDLQRLAEGKRVAERKAAFLADTLKETEAQWRTDGARLQSERIQANQASARLAAVQAQAREAEAVHAEQQQQRAADALRYQRVQQDLEDQLEVGKQATREAQERATREEQALRETQGQALREAHEEADAAREAAKKAEDLMREGRTRSTEETTLRVNAERRAREVQVRTETEAARRAEEEEVKARQTNVLNTLKAAGERELVAKLAAAELAKSKAESELAVVNTKRLSSDTTRSPSVDELEAAQQEAANAYESQKNTEDRLKCFLADAERKRLLQEGKEQGLLQALAQGGRGASPTKSLKDKFDATITEVPIYAWMEPTVGKETLQMAVRQNISALMRQVPAPKSPSGIQKTFMKSYEPEQLFASLTETTVHTEYLDWRAVLLGRLYCLAVHLLRQTSEDGEGQMCAIFVSAITQHVDALARAGRLLTRWRRVKELLLASHTPAVQDVLHILDSSFAAQDMTRVFAEHRSHMTKLVRNSCQPSQWVTGVYRLLAQLRGPAATPEQIWMETRAEVNALIVQEALTRPQLQKFALKAQCTDFSKKGLEEWEEQFRRYEADAPELGEMPAQGLPESQTRGMEAESAASKALLGALKGLADKSSVGGGAGNLQGMIAALSTGNESWRMMSRWVVENGVEGQAAPHDREAKHPLWVAKIYESLDPVAARVLVAGKTLSGADCPGCARRGHIKEWFYHPDAQEFKPDGSRVRSHGSRNAAYYHSTALCPYVWKDVHLHVKANPDKKWMFDKCPAGQDANALA